MANFGRSRRSIADIEHQLYDVFNQHPNTHINDAGEPVIPADNLVDVFRSLADLYGGVQLMNDDETAQLKHLIKSNPGLEVTPTILLGFIAEKTKHSPPQSPSSTDDDNDYPHRGRLADREDDAIPHSPGSDSPDLSNTSAGSRTPSDGPPQTPTSAKSPFDTERRQRSQPLSGSSAPPSSWTKRPAPAHRRKSLDAGSRSDSESSSVSPRTYFGRTPGRSRAPSNPTSPSTVPADLLANTHSPPFSGHPPSRPHSRAQSQPQNHFGSPAFHYDRDDDTIDANPLYDYRSPGHRMDAESFASSISSLTIPRSLSKGEGSDSDSDLEEDSSLGLVLDRSVASSTASMEPLDRLDALQRANMELGKKLMEAERTLQNKLTEHEFELEDMQGRLEEMRTELSATKREEKELRSKERQNMTQMAALEAEIAKVSKALEHARSTYTSLQRQYQEQCAVSEKYRDDLRQREELIRNLRDASSLHDLESLKWSKEHDAYEVRIVALEAELEMAQQAHVQLDEQKQENLLLKETIDRMRFDMDEMRSGLVGGANRNGGGGSAGSSNQGSVSKSLGAELLGKMGRGGWGLDGEEEDLGGGDEKVDKDGAGNGSVESVDDGEETEGEDVIQTIITRKKRKVASRANKVEFSTHRFEETKEYSDSAMQCDPSMSYSTHSSQTLPEPKILFTTSSTQTDPLLPPVEVPTFVTRNSPGTIPFQRVMLEMEIQTDGNVEDDDEVEVPSPPTTTTTPDESLASSSSTILPPTPKAATSRSHLHGHAGGIEHMDSPPAYNQIPQPYGVLATAALKKWHPGAVTGLLSSANASLRRQRRISSDADHEQGVDEEDEEEEISFEPLPHGVSEEAVEEWKALQEELGVGCMVIDKIVDGSVKVPKRSKENRDRKARGAGGRFYNIYNKFYIGAGGNIADGDRASSLRAATSNAEIAAWVGASALVLLAISPYVLVILAPAAHYSIPGGPTYYDRSAWSSFNGIQAAGEGFGFGSSGAGVGIGGTGPGVGIGGGIEDGTAAVWSFLGKVGGGAARIARGWPT